MDRHLWSLLAHVINVCHHRRAISSHKFDLFSHNISPMMGEHIIPLFPFSHYVYIRFRPSQMKTFMGNIYSKWICSTLQKFVVLTMLFCCLYRCVCWETEVHINALRDMMFPQAEFSHSNWSPHLALRLMVPACLISRSSKLWGIRLWFGSTRYGCSKNHWKTYNPMTQISFTYYDSTINC